MKKIIPGVVYWITGLAGAGKTSIGKQLVSHLQKKNAVIFLDGDELREVFNNKNSYSLEERFELSLKYSKLCKLLSNQGINVVCATISMFEKCRDWNRQNITNYIEIFLEVPLDILKQRNQKKLYSNYNSGKEKNIIGLDLNYQKPKNSDIVIENNNKKSLQEIINEIIKRLKLVRR